ncbi:hypothetical protein Q4575_05350 [Psychrosphaera sp. 1_MG-2023]|uniref:hypothetical protein n=1 Tax=Psychrosphaera sp. 1_MG-2023 TaxID=3062643 RepID=UPI0026E11FDE|nr:hypothetical protein [Psychrosphaera sp. 1_MG-2023]MDO6718816.1 hypothetical protein [Psychrosphaera sp. 1_MG-2023]
MIQEALVTAVKELIDFKTKFPGGMHVSVLPSISTTPGISYRLISDRKFSTALNTTKDRIANVQLNVISSSYLTALKLSSELENHLEQVSGERDGIKIALIELDSSVDDINSTPSVVRIINKFTIYYSKG